MQVKFDEELHQYEVDGKKVISVTQLLQKHKLVPSYDAVDKELLRKASERGTLIHEEVETWIKTGIYGFTEEGEQIIDYLARNATPADSIKSEETVFNDIVAGRFDLLYRSGEKMILADIKTGSAKHLYGWAWQLSLYKYLYDKIHGTNIDDLLVFWAHDEMLEVLQVDYVGNDTVEHLLDCEREGELLFDDSLGLTAEEYEELEELLKLQTIWEAKLDEIKSKIYEKKTVLIENMKAKGVKTTDRCNMKITYVAPSQKNSFDSKLFKKEEPDLYKKYCKVSVTEESVRITYKGEKDNG